MKTRKLSFLNHFILCIFLWALTELKFCSSATLQNGWNILMNSSHHNLGEQIETTPTSFIIDVNSNESIFTIDYSTKVEKPTVWNNIPPNTSQRKCALLKNSYLR